MARLDELAEGISKVLTITAEPDPLPLDLIGEGPAETTVLVRAIVGACHRHGFPLSRIAIDPRLGSGLLREHPDGYEGVELVEDANLSNRIEIFRFPT